MKKTNKVLLGILTTLCMLISLNVKAEETASAVVDYNSPKCTINLTNVKIGKSKAGMVICNDDKGLKDSYLDVSDFNNQYSLFKRIEITNIYSRTIANEGKTYIWYFTYKGKNLGKSKVSLKACAVSDYSDNCNWETQPVTISTKLF